MNEDSFINMYLRYTEKSEVPTLLHRWTAISILGAYLGRRPYFSYGHSNLVPNMYIMFVGSVGSKKSTAINIGVDLLRRAGYTRFSAKKTRQEKFLEDLGSHDTVADEGFLDDDSFLDDPKDTIESHMKREPAEVFVAEGEFNNFIGIGNSDFMSILGDLWDYQGVFDYRLKN